jgi:hypothetical protein
MKYLLKNIARNSLIRTILFVLIGLFFWSIRFYHAAGVGHDPNLHLMASNGPLMTAIVFILVSLNAFLLTLCVYRTGLTNLPSAFVGTTAWFVLSAISLWHFSGIVHLTMLVFLLAAMMIAKINIQHEAKEHAYILTLLFCVLSPHIVAIGIGIFYVLAHLLARSRFTWRVLVALFLAIGTYVLYATIFRYFGWCQSLWIENLPHLPWWDWAACIGAYFLAWIICYLPIARPSVASGVIYIIGVIVMLGLGVWQTIQLL